MPDRWLKDLTAEVDRQDSFHAGYTATRDSLRLALATVEDEVREALDGWRADRCKCGVPQCSCSEWPHLREEALQAAAIIARLVRAIDGGCAHDWTESPEVLDGFVQCSRCDKAVPRPANADAPSDPASELEVPADAPSPLAESAERRPPAPGNHHTLPVRPSDRRLDARQVHRLRHLWHLWAAAPEVAHGRRDG